MGKSKENNKLLEIAIILLMALAVMIVHPVKAAASTRVDLREGQTYTCYDVTGDGKSDRFSVRAVGQGYYNAVYIDVNGSRQCIKPKNVNAPFYSLTARLYIFDNGSPLLYLGAESDNDHKYINGILKYENGKWKYLLNMTNIFGNYKQYTRGEVISNSGKELKVRYEVMCWTIGFCRVDYTYVYENGILRRKSSFGQLINYQTRYGSDILTANKTIRAYKGYGTGGTAFVLRAGNNVTVRKWRYTGGKLYIQLKYGTKTGWITGQQAKQFVTSEQKQFSNAPYV